MAAGGAARARGVPAGDGMMGFDLIFGPSVERGPRNRLIYLTFDDGPNERATPAILETLAKFRVPAAFFLVGDHVRRFPSAARDVASAGHLVGNHTYNHVKLHFAGPKRIRTQLKKTHDAIESVVEMATILRGIGCRPRRLYLGLSRMGGTRATNSHPFPHC